MKNKKFGLIIPFYNYANAITATLDKIKKWKESGAVDILVVFVDDGSFDATPVILTNFQNENSDWCSVIIQPRNLGKGAAVRAAFLSLADKVENIIFTDCDLHYGLSILNDRIMPELETNDIVIADRSWTGSSSHQAISRRISSYIFNRLMATFTGVIYRDSQAGLKGFRVEVCRPIFEILQTNGFVFDVEILAIAMFYRLRIKQVAISFSKEHHFPEQSSIKLLGTSLRMLFDLIHINIYWKLGRYYHRELEDRINKSIYEVR